MDVIGRRVGVDTGRDVRLALIDGKGGVESVDGGRDIVTVTEEDYVGSSGRCNVGVGGESDGLGRTDGEDVGA